MNSTKWEKRRKRIYDIIEVGSDFDAASRRYDYANAAAIILNLTITILMTFDEVRTQYMTLLTVIEQITLAFFAVDYVLRIWTAKVPYKNEKSIVAIKNYVFSFNGIIDLLSFLPEYLPIFFPGGTVAFRMIRIVRIFRLFRINYYFDSLNVISAVLKSRKQQLVSSVFIIMILMIASSLCMYSLEHEAQPEVFDNAFSGIWWAASSLLTVGYGDIYPITILGKVFGIFITFLGVGVVAIPTGIISAGFVEQYEDMKRETQIGYTKDMNFIKVPIKAGDKWNGKAISELGLPSRVLMVMLIRGEEMIIPRGDIVLQIDDVLIFGAHSFKEGKEIHLTETLIKEEHPWVGSKIKDLDISRHSIIVLVKRRNKAHIPYGDFILKEWDRVYMYTQKYVVDGKDIEI